MKNKLPTVVLCDCPWSFSDSLKMSNTPRGAAANYSLMSNKDIKELRIKEISSEDSLLALWVPSSLLPTGLEVMDAWGFRHVQTWVWVKTKQDPAIELKKQIKVQSKSGSINIKDLNQVIDNFDFNKILDFKMGRLFRQCHELVLIGVRGKIYNELKNKSQRSVSILPATKHSVKPEDLHNRLELMFPNSNKIELFARQSKPGWLCLGNQVFPTENEDIRDSLAKVNNLTDINLIEKLLSLDSNNMPSQHDQENMQKMWRNIPKN